MDDQTQAIIVLIVVLVIVAIASLILAINDTNGRN